MEIADLAETVGAEMNNSGERSAALLSLSTLMAKVTLPEWQGPLLLLPY